MTERYPFFRDEAECTIAVIGEAAAIADLNGTYQKSYAILTQQRLYCKNEQGNFMVESAHLLNAGVVSATSMFFWIAFSFSIFLFIFVDWRISLIGLFMLVLSVLFQVRRDYFKAQLSLIVYPILSFMQSVVSLVVSNSHTVGNFSNLNSRFYYLFIFAKLLIIAVIIISIFCAIKNNKSSTFQISHTRGIFCFPSLAYSPNELKRFRRTIKQLKAGTFRE